ncbi:MAG TPA: putative DNA modification/repair radical SAM protein [Clostridium sp.]|uniref:DNA modification/repair radical SAM protein n=1 Tax=Clostridium lapidicellarium TaxID=3240931 RepID=A0ABV4DZI7_9CLOT|nr:putative DNA modification/repair radical SAM protein [uncultured Clostridium sp.]NLU09073.1 putative DNA modification/repair radical SAM protein [Clostridiales bacterium]HBC96673.1 putative DNA modification/repair radical SAM protein [Clostridium sp.]
MDVFDKLRILTDAAKYDVSCTSSGVNRRAQAGGIGSSAACGICHSFSADGRCISLLKILMTNVCVYDCKYCVNRRSNDVPRTSFTPCELADLTMNFYRRNYIEGLFLSSGVIRNPDYTCELMIRVLEILRNDYKFFGYIHVKAIPGADSRLVHQLGILGDRMSVNIELPSQKSLKLLAPDKSKHSILTPMGYIRDCIRQNSKDTVRYRHASGFAPAGQSTQMIIGATPDTDFHILNLAEGLYRKYKLKRVFFSAYIPVSENSLLPKVNTRPPLLREHRLYQADWLLRHYGFKAGEILDERHQSFDPYIDPKCNWALNHREYFPVEINRAPYEKLLRVPGIGVKSAKRIVAARKDFLLSFESLKKLGVVLKRAQYFILCSGKIMDGLTVEKDSVIRALMSKNSLNRYYKDFTSGVKYEQLSFL